jgi:N-acetylmuramoyl-L-alanine amidase
LVLKSSGTLELSESVSRYPERLTLTMLHAETSPCAIAVSSGAVRQYTVKTTTPGTVELALDLRYESHYSLEYSADRHALAIHFAPSPLAGKVIVLDAGHGGIEPGALGPKTGLREKDINLDVTLRLKELLEGAGAAVYLTRVDDTYVPLLSRAPYANRLPAQYFISMHANAHPDPTVNGVEVFYYPERVEDGRLAALILEDMVSALALKPLGAKAYDYAVLRDSQMVAVLVEIGFLTNPAEEARLATDEFRQLAAEAVFRAIDRFAQGEAPAVGRGPGLMG